MKSNTNLVLKNFPEGENPETQAAKISKARQNDSKAVVRDKANIENITPGYNNFRLSQLEHLLGMLKNEEVEVRKESVFSLGSLGTIAVPYIRQALDDQDVVVRREAILSLGRIGRDAAAAIPDLDRMISSEGRKQLGDNYNKTIAQAALKKIM